MARLTIERRVVAQQLSLEAWKMQAMEAIWRCAKNNQMFIVDAVWQILGVRTDEDRVMGQMMRKAKALKWIASTKVFKQSASPKSRGNWRMVWESLITERS